LSGNLTKKLSTVKNNAVCSSKGCISITCGISH